MTTSLIIKPEQKRLNRSIHTGVGQTNIRINLAPETGNRAQFARQMPEQRHHGCKRLDRSAEQRQGGREDVLLGECQFIQQVPPYELPHARIKQNTVWQNHGCSAIFIKAHVDVLKEQELLVSVWIR
ncbi:hypothetical protein PH5382_03812 [Phaeobacter sp. CECT 5382]|nr:hypothetical protein PH5382_03812 [Phaeobacter sp. CECT 5382]